MAFAAITAMSARNANIYDNNCVFDTDSGPVGIDNRCSACISHEADDFVGPLLDCNRAIKGFGGTRTVGIKMGTIRWRWLDDDGKIHTFLIPKSYYVPQGKVRLLSPQHLAQQLKDVKPQEGTRCITESRQITLEWAQRQYKLTVNIGKMDNVATFHLAPGISRYEAFCAEIDDNDEDPIIVDSATYISDDEEDAEATAEDMPNPGGEEDENQQNEFDNHRRHWSEPTPTDFNLDGPQSKRSTPVTVEDDEEDRQPTNQAAELLRFHHRYNHIPFPKLQEMAKQGIIPKRLAKCPIPACSACMFAKATKKKWRDKSSNNKDEATKPQRPGEVVSVDQMVSPTPGLVAQLTGILTTKRYRYATVFVDQASRLSYVYLQKTATAEETIEAKKAFERYAAERNVKIHAYHADNGIFKANKWVDECKNSGQQLTFAGVNAHHQNGIAERRIRELQGTARTMLIHARRRWPNSVTMNLWPYAVRMANDAFNESPNMKHPTRKNPHEVFSNTNVSHNPKHWKHFGCPVYVLERELQQTLPFHKWKERSKIGIYLGRSPQHARNVALVLDRTTGLVSPQFHVAFDSSFHTTKDDNQTSEWQKRAGFVQAPKQHEPPIRNSTIATKTKSEKGLKRSQRNRSNEPHTKKVRIINEPMNRPEQQQSPEPPKSNAEEQLQQSERNLTPQEETNPRRQTGSDLGSATRQSGRKRQTIHRLIEVMTTEIVEQTSDDVIGEIYCLQALYPQEEENTKGEDPLMAYKATADPDSMYLHQAMKEPDRAEFIKAMHNEVKGMIDKDTFRIKKRSEVPEGVKILPTVWQMRRKRDIKTRQVKKWKARLNIDGSRMEKGIHYDQTYAPVASWNSIRILLTLVAVHGWHTKQLDYVAAFPQAPVEKDLYMTIPKGFEVEGATEGEYVLQLARNIYGQKQAGRVWNKYLVDKLVNELKFTQSKIDECVFYRGKTLYVLYTDDSILAGPNEAEIEKIIQELKDAQLDITIEGNLDDFLGVNIDRKPDGTIHLTQPHLIDQILKDLKMDDERVKGKSTPASCSQLLSRHTDSVDFDNSFNYRSVIGKLNYLEKATRSDIAYITHQCARFTTAPKIEHGKALRWLGRYLKATRDKGTILKPLRNKDLEVFVDADFAGNWDSKETQDRDTARSRHGYIIMYAGCPILWKSQLQNEIALSSTESEYTGMSYALREAIPIMELLKEMKQNNFPIHSVKPRIHCEVFEDNSGALEIATNHKFRPRTKHLNVKLHHFRDYVSRGEISIHPIDTSVQPADFLTKALNEETLQRHRRTVMGW